MKNVPPQSADALERLRFLEGTWHCTVYSSDSTVGPPFKEDLLYTYMPGDYWLKEDTILTEDGKRVWRYAVYVGRDDGYKGRADWITRPLTVWTAGDDWGGVPVSQAVAGWSGGDFKIFDEYGGVVTLKRTGANSLEWRTNYTAYHPTPSYFGNALRKCTR